MITQELPTRFGAVIEASVRVGETTERRWLSRSSESGTWWVADHAFRGRTTFADSAIVRDQRVVVWFAGVGGGGQA